MFRALARILHRNQQPQAQGILEKLDIPQDKLAFFMSNRKGRRGQNIFGTARRTSDNKTSIIPYRPNVAYDAPRNMLHYNPVTWGEWVLGAGHTVDVNGLNFVVSGSYVTSSIVAFFKPSTKYGFLLFASSNTLATGLVTDYSSGRPFADAEPVLGGLTTGNVKSIHTSASTITANLFSIKRGNNEVGSALLKDIRVFELPTGSQIESDFTNLTADELNIKYPMVGANGAAIGQSAGIQKDRVCNAFANGDGRYGTIGWSATSSGSFSPINGGVRHTGNGSVAYQIVAPNNNSSSFKTSVSRKYYVRLLVNVHTDANNFRGISYNSVTYKTLELYSQITKGQLSWCHGIITQTDLGTTPLMIYCASYYPDSATQNGKTLDVKYWTIVDMGDSASDPLYTKTADEMYTWMQTAQGVQRTPDGGYFLPAYGLCSGEPDLDIIATFGGTSSLYDTGVAQQEKHILPLNQLLVNGDFGNGTTGWATNSELTVSNGILSITADGDSQFPQIYRSAPLSGKAIIGHKIIGKIRWRVTNSVCQNLVVRIYKDGGTAIQKAIANPIMNKWYEEETTELFTQTEAGNLQVLIFHQYADIATATGKTMEIDYVKVWDATTDIGVGFEPTATEMNTILSSIGNPYWEGIRQVDCSTAFTTTQATAASQPKLWDNGLLYQNYFDGTDDYMVADLPDITTAPCTWWCKSSQKAVGQWLFIRNLGDTSNIQYGMNTYSSLYLNNLSRATVLVDLNKETLIAFSWDGSFITPYKIAEGVMTIGTPVAFSGALTTQPNKFIGCRSNAVDGSLRSAFMSGEIHEIGMALAALTPAQIQKLDTV